MKMAVTCNGETEDQPVEERFGRCAVFAIYDDVSGDLGYVVNEAKDASSGAGVKAAQQLMDLEVGLLITGRVGPGAQEVLDEGGIRVETWTAGSVGEAVRRFGTRKAR
ncbi:MAG: NifB/NifX family molybdenum-iron cluster-binding protein [Methanomassiliicoccus sp.]|nr:NifB/NifX family molybdenum-iron cluster-binding protein [Methanomassiliicoccus sp.]